MNKSNLLKGVFFTSFASTFWGIPQPLIFNQIKYIPALEVVSHRALWSFIFLFLIITFIGRIKDFFLIFYSYKILVILSISAILISINWIGFIFAVSFNRIQDASMGYFLTPLVSISLGYFFLNEKISKKKILSILLVIISVIYLIIIDFKSIPWVGIAVALSWGFYNLLRKKISVSTDIGLFIESLFILPFILIVFYFITKNNLNDFSFSNPTLMIILMMAGPMTVIPLFLYVRGVEMCGLGPTGMVFYITPTLQFILGYFLYNEPFNHNQLVSFILIWIAVFIYLRDLYENI